MSSVPKNVDVDDKLAGVFNAVGVFNVSWLKLSLKKAAFSVAVFGVWPS